MYVTTLPDTEGKPALGFTLRYPPPALNMLSMMPSICSGQRTVGADISAPIDLRTETAVNGRFP